MMDFPAIHYMPDIPFEDFRRREIYRYLRLEGSEPDEETKADVERNLRRLMETARIAKTAELRPVRREGNILHFGSFQTESRVLAENLKTSEYVVLFAITLGAAVDRLINKLTVLSKTDAFMTDACATEMLESYANDYCREIKEAAASYDLTTHPRFSPGFADFGLEHQWPLIRTLKADKKIHIALTDGNMLIPTKTITAIMGLDKRR
ncbi:hypothetical protein [Aedoeadaptatus coxii]|uniref:hypothetical protein n=1 Tax=Aedoeadaptatus coxii TaxID=755172 RepID=UPI002AD1D563|nr:hypothetical protein [Peptoniphilus coxii]